MIGRAENRYLLMTSCLREMPEDTAKASQFSRSSQANEASGTMTHIMMPTLPK